MPKRIDLAAERKSIARAAIGVIAGAGLDAARLRDVAAAADVTTGAVTHYFDGKDAVLEAALDEIAGGILAELAAADALAAPPTAAEIVEIACEFLPLSPDEARSWRVWVAYWGRAIVNERLRRRHRDVYAAFGAKLGRAIAWAQEAGTVSRACPAPVMADLIVSAIDGIGIRATLEPEDWPPERQRDALRKLLLPLLSPAETA